MFRARITEQVLRASTLPPASILRAVKRSMTRSRVRHPHTALLQSDGSDPSSSATLLLSPNSTVICMRHLYWQQLQMCTHS